MNGSTGCPVLRVLVVDDYPDTAESVCILLSIWGFQARTARDGREALEAARTFRPHVVLLDMGIRKQDGYELARQLRLVEGMAAVTLLAVTGHARGQDLSRMAQSGFDGCLVKPVAPEALEAILRGLAARLLKGAGGEADGTGG